MHTTGKFVRQNLLALSEDDVAPLFQFRDDLTTHAILPLKKSSFMTS